MTDLEKRKKIGVIIDAVHEPYQSGIWKGIAKRAKDENVDLLSFVGTSQDGVDHFDTHYDLVLDFAKKCEIDGVIIFSGSITEHHGKEFVNKLCSSFLQIPLICVSEKVEGYPCVLVENGPGIVATVDHFIQFHNLRSIAFVKGPDGHIEAQQRLEAYKHGLESNKIEFNPELIFDGGFIARDGALAVKKLIEKNIYFDGIITVNDDTAFGVLKELTAQGKHVPGEVAIAGFDDVTEAALIQPSLTTVRQPLNEMGKSALDLILLKIKGKTIALETVLPTKPVYRRSCGCFSNEVNKAKAVHKHVHGLDVEQIVKKLTSTCQEIFGQVLFNYLERKEFETLVTNLIESLIWDVKKPIIRNIFLNEIDLFLFKTVNFNERIALIKLILIELMVYVTSLFETPEELGEGNNLLQQAQTFVWEFMSTQKHSLSQAEKYYQLRINVSCQRIISSFEQRELLESMAKVLPDLEIQNFSIALFSKQGIDRSKWMYPGKSDLLLAYNFEKKEFFYPRKDKKIQTSKLMPESLEIRNRPANHIFMPLYFRNDYLGYALFEYTQKAPLFMYEELRLHISSAIKSSMLLRKFKEQSTIDELTGVYNRRGFLDTAHRAFEASKTGKVAFFVFYADVDGLKIINDTWGHEDGDMVISEAASVLKDTFRERDIIARIGGDEFVVAVSTGHSEGLAEKIIRRFKQRIKEYNSLLDKPWFLSVSIGVAQYNEIENETLEILMKRADADLLQKKRNRRF